MVQTLTRPQARIDDATQQPQSTPQPRVWFIRKLPLPLPLIPVGTVTVRVRITPETQALMPTRDAITFAGRTIVRRPYHDSAPTLGDGVRIVSGTLPAWGGSKLHPEIFDGPSDGCVVEISGLYADDVCAERRVPWQYA